MVTFALLKFELVKCPVGICPTIIFLLLENEKNLLCWVAASAELGLPLGGPLGVPQPTGALLVHVVSLED